MVEDDLTVLPLRSCCDPGLDSEGCAQPAAALGRPRSGRRAPRMGQNGTELRLREARREVSGLPVQHGARGADDCWIMMTVDGFLSNALTSEDTVLRILERK